jgi:hypothetical protein
MWGLAGSLFRSRQIPRYARSRKRFKTILDMLLIASTISPANDDQCGAQHHLDSCEIVSAHPISPSP